MKGALFLAGWMLTGAGAQAADEIEPLDLEFLDYLANMETDDDNWTLLDDREQQRASNSAESEKPATDQATQEAAKPAVEER